MLYSQLEDQQVALATSSLFWRQSYSFFSQMPSHFHCLIGALLLRPDKYNKTLDQCFGAIFKKLFFEEFCCNCLAFLAFCH